MSPFFFFFFCFFLLLPSQTSTHSCSQPISSSNRNRRVLHQPLFPLPTVYPPSLSPSLPPSSPPPISFPKYPFSTNPSPFFPFFTPPSQPPPSTTTTTTPVLPTYPANITSLILPTSQNVHKKSSIVKKVVVAVAVVVPVVALTVLGSVCFFLIYRRRRRRSFQLPEKSVLSDNRRLFPPNTRTSDGRKISGGASTTTDVSSSDFLYLGTIANSRSGGGGGSDTTTLDGTSGGGGSVRISSPYRKLGSPELRPLPPLSKHSGIVYVNAEGGCSSDDEYYSPRESAVEKEKGRLSSDTTLGGSRRVLLAPAVSVEKLQSRMPDMNSFSYPSSNSISSPTPPSSPSPRSSPQLSSTPGRSSPQSPSFGSENLTVLKDNVTVGICHPPPPPLLQPPVHPLTPSHPLSPPEGDSDLNLKIPNFSGQNPMIVKEVRRNTLFTGPPLSASPPPRPPPPPPLGHWETKSPKVVELPSLVPPRPIGVKTSTPSSFFPAESPRTYNDTERKNDETPRPKLKPLHWDKVRASSDCAMVWDQLRSSSFQLNEEMIETLFGCDPSSNAPPGMGKRHVPLATSQENRVLDPKKSQNIAILLRALNVTKEEVCEALLEGNTDSLGAELLETLLKMAPSKEEEINLKEHKDDTPFKLGPAERFLKAVLDIPFAFKRVDAMLYATNFDSEVNYLKKSFETIEAACEELRKSRMFMKLLEAVLKTGNRMNVGTNRGDAQAFKLDTLLKLVDVKGTDGKTTLLHFVVQEIIRAEGSRLSVAKQTHQPNGEPQVCSLRDDLEFKKLGLQVVAGLSGELSNVKKAAAMDSDVLSSYVSKLASGIGKVNEVIRLSSANGCSKERSLMFQESMSGFLKKAEDEIIKIQAMDNATLSLVREITEYFHGNSVREEAHPFRIFMVVRDFLSSLDQVCKEVAKINDRSFVSSARQFPVLANTMQPPIFPVFQSHQRASGSSEDDDDDTSSSSC